MDSSDERSFVTAPSQPCVAETQLELGVADEFLVEVSKLEEKLGKIGNQVFTPTQTSKIRTVMSKVEEKLKETDTPMTGKSQYPATMFELRKTTAKAMSYIAAAMEQMTNVTTALGEKASPRTNKSLQPRAEIQHSQIAEHHVTKNEIEELTEALRLVSVMPDTRLVIAYPCDSEQYLSEDSLVSIRQRLNGKALYGVIQSPKHADYTFPLPGYERFKIQIIYDPKSNYCYLGWKNVGAGEDGPDTISITNLDIMRLRRRNSEHYMLNHTPWNILELSKFIQITPGCWRIRVKSAGKEHPGTIDILFLRRPFEVTITGINTDSKKKRKHIDNIKDNRLKKRLKISFSEGINVIQAANNNTTLELQPFAKLGIRDKAVIKSTDEGEENLYSLQITESLGETRITRVFSCQYSRIPAKLIAVKALCYDSSDISRVARLWTREVRILENLDHENIVKLLGYDARILAIFQELLPQSLDCKTHELFRSPSRPSWTLKILQGLSSALAYLSVKGYVHNDIKPANITYSPERGVVLLDFGMASYSSDTSETIGGSPWYIPPEYLNSQSRGFSGDMWALGITMLYLLDAISLPDKSRGWNIFEAFNTGSHDRWLMELWLGKIESIRLGLCQKDEWNEVKVLVAKMLHNKAKARVTAAQLEALAIKLK